jgi:hypothetical protein
LLCIYVIVPIINKGYKGGKMKKVASGFLGIIPDIFFFAIFALTVLVMIAD